MKVAVASTPTTQPADLIDAACDFEVRQDLCSKTSARDLTVPELQAGEDRNQECGQHWYWQAAMVPLTPWKLVSRNRHVRLSKLCTGITVKAIGR